MTLVISEIGRLEMFKAFRSAQSEMDGAKKTANNPAFKAKYADLSAVCDAVMGALTKHGIAVMQSPSVNDDGSVCVETVLMHEAGGTISSALSIRPSKTDAHGIGSAITYARRYSLSALCGIAPDDDDGNAASIVGGGKTAPIAAQARREMIWPEVEAKLREATDEAELDRRAKWYLANNKIPLAWKQNFDDEWEMCRNNLISARGEMTPFEQEVIMENGESIY